VVWRDRGEECVSSAALLTYILRIPEGQQHAGHGKRLSAVMKQLGWQRKPSGKVFIDGHSVNGYFQPNYTDPRVQDEGERAYEDWWQRREAMGDKQVSFSWQPRLREAK